MQLLVQGLDILDSGFDGLLLVPAALGLLPVLVTTSLCVANSHVEVSDLMRVLAGSWNLDRATPIEIAVTKGECQLLDVDLFHRTFIQRDETVSGKYATLIGGSRRDEEIKGLEALSLVSFAFTGRASMFNKTFVNDATTWRVVKSSSCFIFQEESLVDSLIDYDKSNLRLCSVLWIELADCLLEL